MFKVTEINNNNKKDLNKANQPFEIIGCLNIEFKNGKWEFSEVLFTASTYKQYPNYDGANADDYITSTNRTAFFAYHNAECVGQILLAKTWNNYVHIEDISVSKEYRGQGVGALLLSNAYSWAKSQNIKAVSLECQTNNILALRFLCKNGFEIGGVNTKLYATLGEPYSNETAIFLYKNI
jgi:ribosomal protein S18 acetylase RimI-like enzyme